jgi:3D (Asp-Asp-Asp) domain-containing protein
MRGTFRIIATIAALGVFALGGARPGHVTVQPRIIAASPPVSAGAAPANKLDLYMEAYVTGYNTVREQTDGDPCIAASGANICGRRDTVACPRLFDLGTVVEINGRKYTCEDRTAKRLRGNFDINCDKDKNCPYAVAGWKTVRIYLE